MGLTESILTLGTAAIGRLGYAGVFLLMAAESMVLPVPSEAVMPFAGFLVAEGVFSWILAVGLATLGSITGSLLSYVIGRSGGRALLARHGRYLLLSVEDLERTDRFFQRRGRATIFVARFIPVVRHLISLPAGAARMKLLPFSLSTIVGAGIWNAFLTGCGFVLGSDWATVARYGRTVDIVAACLLLGAVALWVLRHLRRRS